MNDNYKIRQMKRNGYYKICNKNINKMDEKIIAFYNSARESGNDFICFDCVCDMRDSIYLEKVNNVLSGKQ